MGDKSAIQWTDATWNPVTGCSKVSPGCAHCYAETLTKRYAKAWNVPGLPWTPENADQNVILKPERLEHPLRWRRSRMVFVNSMSDLFHENVPYEYIREVFNVMRRCDGSTVAATGKANPSHIFQVLTKRPERMRELALSGALGYNPEHPPANIWLGTSIENRRFVHRADLLRETPAAVRFISAEPLLGPLVPDGWLLEGAGVNDTDLWVDSDKEQLVSGRFYRRPVRTWTTAPSTSEFGQEPGLDLDGIDWLIVGGESGPGHRPMKEQWVTDLLDLCLETRQNAAGTSFFFKQWGGASPKSGGRELGGQTWDEMPEVST